MKKLEEYVRRARQELQSFMDDPAARRTYTSMMRSDECFSIALDENNRQHQIDALAFQLMRHIVPDTAPRTDAIEILQQNPTVASDILNNLVPRRTTVGVPIEQRMHDQLADHLRRRVAVRFRGLGAIIDDPKAVIAFVRAGEQQQRRRRGLTGVTAILDKVGDELLDICADPEEFQKFHSEMWGCELRHSKDTRIAAKVLLDRVLPNPFPRHLALELLLADDTLCQEELEEPGLRCQVLEAIAEAIIDKERPLLEKFNDLYLDEIWPIDETSTMQGP